MDLDYSISEKLLKKLELLTWGGEGFRDDLIKLLLLPTVLHLTHSVWSKDLINRTFCAPSIFPFAGSHLCPQQQKIVLYCSVCAFKQEPLHLKAGQLRVAKDVKHY